MMDPEEFISRCLDAAVRVLDHGDKSQFIHSSNMVDFRHAGMLFQGFAQPLSFEYIDNEFTIEFMLKDEMVLCSAEMLNDQSIYRAALIFSQQTNQIITHWVCSDDLSNINQELVLLKIGTNNFINFGDRVCK